MTEYIALVRTSYKNDGYMLITRYYGSKKQFESDLRGNGYIITYVMSKVEHDVFYMPWLETAGSVCKSSSEAYKRYKKFKAYEKRNWESGRDTAQIIADMYDYNHALGANY